MTATYSQVPAELIVVCVQGDELNISFTVGADLTGYEIEAAVYEPVVETGGAWTGEEGFIVGDTQAEFSINVVDLAEGQFNLGLTETQTDSLSPASAHRWYLRWTDGDGVTRTAASGQFVVRIP